MDDAKHKKTAKCPGCGLVCRTADDDCPRCGASLVGADEREGRFYVETEAEINTPRIHQWDGAALKRALLWALVFEAICVGLFLVTPEHTGSVNPHNPPPLGACCLGVVYLPAAIIFPHKTFGYVPMVILHTLMVAYILFVRYRLKNIKAGQKSGT